MCVFCVRCVRNLKFVTYRLQITELSRYIYIAGLPFSIGAPGASAACGLDTGPPHPKKGGPYGTLGPAPARSVFCYIHTNKLSAPLNTRVGAVYRVFVGQVRCLVSLLFQCFLALIAYCIVVDFIISTLRTHIFIYIYIEPCG